MSASSAVLSPPLALPPSDTGADTGARIRPSPLAAGTCRGHPRDRPGYVHGWRARDGEDWHPVRCKSFRCRDHADYACTRVARRVARAVTSWGEPCLITVSWRNPHEPGATC